MKDKSNLTPNELMVMKILWSSDKAAMSAKEIILAAPQNKEWQDKSLHYILRSLQEKGFADEVGVTSESPYRLSHTWGPLILEDEYLAVVFGKDFANKDPLNVLPGIVAALIDEGSKRSDKKKLLDKIQKKIDEMSEE